MKEDLIDGIIIIGMVVELEEKTLEEQIQERILNLPDNAITTFMHLLCKWNKHKQVVEFTPANIGALVVYGNSMGWDVELDVEIGHDYHLVGEYVKKNGVDTYRIYGIHNEFDEWADLLKIHTLVGEVAKDNSKQFLLKQIEDIYNV